MPIDADAPYALKDASEIERRRTMMTLPHISPLAAYADHVRAQRGAGYEMPLFDPCDGGVEAQLLFLLEAPGPRAVASTFISRNNPDVTARNMNLLLAEAGIPRKSSLLWNIIPWYLGDGKRIRAARKADVQAGLTHLGELLALLRNLRAIALVGRAAASAAPAIREITKLPVHFAPHPSPKVFNVYPHKRAESLDVFKSLRTYCV